MKIRTRVHADRLGAFSDAVIAVIITIMVLELKAPESTTFAGLLPLWPTAVAYLVSFLFIAIIRTNHHHLLRFVQNATNRLIWVNFAHLFMVSLVPFATAWIAEAHVAPAPVVVYAAIFFASTSSTGSSRKKSSRRRARRRYRGAPGLSRAGVRLVPSRFSPLRPSWASCFPLPASS